MIERFGLSEFESYLEDLVGGNLHELFALHVTVLPLGLKQGEYCYKLPLPNNGWLWIRSSIEASGMAAAEGEDSIRLWVGDVAGQPLLGKKQRWTTRLPGWRERLTEQVRLLLVDWQQRGELVKRMDAFRQGGGRAMYSKYDGFCKLCKQPFDAGTPIKQLNVKGRQAWVHFECPLPESPVVAVLPAHEYDQASLDALSEFFSTEVTVAVSETKPVFTPSRYQQAIFDFIQHGTGHGVVEAVAGSGKTTTLIQALQYVPVYLPVEDAGELPVDREARVIFLAFNRHIALELANRQKAGLLPEHVQVRTVHSLGLKNLVEGLRISNTSNFVDDTKLATLMNEFPQLSRERSLPVEERLENILRRQLVEQLVSLCKGTLVYALQDARRMDILYDLVDHYGIDLNGFTEDDLALVPQLLQRCADVTEVIDFDDMVWLPVQLGMTLQKFDFMFVDEAQDLNAVQIEFILRSLAPGGRIIAVGDRNQSLYGFRGADTEAIPRLIEMLHATVLPLSITYRCPLSHVTLAQALVPQIEARENAPEGLVATILPKQVALIARPGDMVICRTNAPLVPLAYQLIRQGTKAVVRGRDIGKGLVQLIDKFDANSIPQLSVSTKEYLDRETLRLANAEKWEQLQQLQDRIETIHAVASEAFSLLDLRSKLEKLFSDEVQGVVFSSVHRAKGLQARRVFILRPDLLPHPLAKLGWQLVQELNAKYVALTRSESELFFVEE